MIFANKEERILNFTDRQFLALQDVINCNDSFFLIENNKVWSACLGKCFTSSEGDCLIFVEDFSRQSYEEQTKVIYGMGGENNSKPILIFDGIAVWDLQEGRAFHFINEDEPWEFACEDWSKDSDED